MIAYPDGLDELNTLSDGDVLRDTQAATKLKTLVEQAAAAGNHPAAEYLECLRLAFSFCVGHDDRDDRWLRPCVGFSDGTEWPTLDTLPEIAADVYRMEVERTSLPAVRSRCLDLLWELRQGHECARQAVQEHLAVVAERLEQELLSSTDEEDRLYIGPALVASCYRAVQLATSLKADELTKQAAEAIMGAVARLLAASRPRWCIDLVRILQANRKAYAALDDPVPLGRHIQRLIEIYRENAEQAEGWHFVRMALDLAIREARCLCDTERVRELIRQQGDSFVAEAEWKAEHYGNMVAAAFYEQAIETYRAGNVPKQDLERACRRLEELLRLAEAEMKCVEVPFEIPQQAIEEAKEHVRRVVQEHGIQALIVTALSWMRPMPELQVAAREILAESGFLRLITKSAIGDGQVISRQQTPEENERAEVVGQCLRNLSIGALEANWALCQLREEQGLDLDVFDQLAAECDVFAEWRRPVLRAAFSRFLEGDFLSFMHIIVPQMEGILRDVLSAAGCAVTKPRSRNGAFVTDMLNIDELLAEPATTHILDERIVFAWRSVLTDQEGYNLRHRMAHGIRGGSTASKKMALVVLLLLCPILALRRRPPTEEE